MAKITETAEVYYPSTDDLNRWANQTHYTNTKSDLMSKVQKQFDQLNAKSTYSISEEDTNSEVPDARKTKTKSEETELIHVIGGCSHGEIKIYQKSHSQGLYINPANKEEHDPRRISTNFVELHNLQRYVHCVLMDNKNGRPIRVLTEYQLYRSPIFGEVLKQQDFLFRG